MRGYVERRSAPNGVRPDADPEPADDGREVGEQPAHLDRPALMSSLRRETFELVTKRGPPVGPRKSQVHFPAVGGAGGVVVALGVETSARSTSRSVLDSSAARRARLETMPRCCRWRVALPARRAAHGWRGHRIARGAAACGKHRHRKRRTAQHDGILGSQGERRWPLPPPPRSRALEGGARCLARVARGHTLDGAPSGCVRSAAGVQHRYAAARHGPRGCWPRGSSSGPPARAGCAAARHARARWPHRCADG